MNKDEQRVWDETRDEILALFKQYLGTLPQGFTIAPLQQHIHDRYMEVCKAVIRYEHQRWVGEHKHELATACAEEREKAIMTAKSIVLSCYLDEDSREHRIHDDALDLVYSRLDALNGGGK